jgi:large subunit ribosomal protein L25
MSIELNAETRTDEGKGASRRLRHAEKMPAIIYGAGKDPISLVFAQKDIRAHQDSEAFYSSIISLKIDGKKAQKVIVRDVQHHPFKIDMMHVDFQRIDAKSKMHIHVPLHFIGEDKSPGVKTGGLVNHVIVEVEVECLPKDIPEFIEVDISALDTGDILHLSEIVVPKGVVLMALKQGEDHDTAVVAIHAPKVVVEADDESDGDAATDEEADKE